MRRLSFFFPLTILWVLSFAPLSSFSNDDHPGIHTITGEGVQLTVKNHSLEGSINGYKVSGKAGCGNTPTLTIDLQGEQVTGELSKNNERKLYGGIFSSTKSDRNVEIYFLSHDFPQKRFEVEINGRKTEVEFDYEKREGKHFYGITLKTSLRDRDLNVFYTGKACPSLLVSFSMMILSAASI